MQRDMKNGLSIQKQVDKAKSVKGKDKYSKLQKELVR